MSCGTSAGCVSFLLSSNTGRVIRQKEWKGLPQVHAVHEWIGSIRWELALVCHEVGNVPHQFVHDLWELDWVS